MNEQKCHMPVRQILPGARTGTVRIPASKSQAHRLLICAALGDTPAEIRCDGISKDIAATMDCLNALGASVRMTDESTFIVIPIASVPRELCHLRCGESGSTLRFLLPLVGALGAQAVFHMEGRLPQRPMEPLSTQLCAHGMTLRQENDLLYCKGALEPGAYELPGNVSSQYISGLLMALPRLSGNSTLTVTGKTESAAYITMTEDALRLGQIALRKTGNCYEIPGNQHCALPSRLQVEGDYSNAAFFLCAGAISGTGITVSGLNPASAQGDRAILNILSAFGADVRWSDAAVTVCPGTLTGREIDASPIPDLIPVLSVVASVCRGETRFVNAGRLRLKESDRLASTAQTLRTLGADICVQDDSLIVRGVPTLLGGSVDAVGDHRIAMTAAVAACVCTQPVTVMGCDCVQKSYPRFWADFDSLEGGLQ